VSASGACLITRRDLFGGSFGVHPSSRKFICRFTGGSRFQTSPVVRLQGGVVNPNRRVSVRFTKLLYESPRFFNYPHPISSANPHIVPGIVVELYYPTPFDSIFGLMVFHFIELREE
jgi:hypothetical protein